ncbi:MAG: hypothetical protein LBR93_07650 [Treponema sp.]|jgi:hypothetical protein|nr:hypothetical protein [Treponema sp.]
MSELLVVNNNGVSVSDINSEIKQGIITVKNGLITNPGLREKVINKVVEKKIIHEVEFNYDLSGINIYNELEDFLKIRNSDITKKVTKNGLVIFYNDVN